MTQQPLQKVGPDARPYSDLVMQCYGEGLTAPAYWDKDGIRRAWAELDGLDWHDDLCTPDCLTRRAHAQQLHVAKLARPRLTEAQLDHMANQAWDSLPPSHRQSFDQRSWREGFGQAARMLCNVVDGPKR